MVTRLIVLTIPESVEILKHYVVLTGTNTVLQVNYTSKQTSKLPEEEIRFVVYLRGGAGNWMKAAETYKLPVVR